MPQPERPEVTRVSTSFGIDSSTVRSLDGTSLELADHHVARLTIDEGEDAVLVAEPVNDNGTLYGIN